ncbi:hypothetical protein AURDEDRAFT_152989, partial [Auricularia subglabra TFB-10046 SS5]
MNAAVVPGSAAQDEATRTASPTTMASTAQPTTTGEQPAMEEGANHVRKGSIPATVSSVAGTVSDAGTARTNVTLPRDVVAKLEKTEAKEAKQVSKVLEKEGKTSEREVASAIKELGALEKEHKKGAKGEASAQKASMKAASKAHKLEVAYLKAKSKYDQAQADVEAKAALLQTAKTHTASIHERLQAKTKEVEEMRQRKAIGDRQAWRGAGAGSDSDSDDDYECYYGSETVHRPSRLEYSLALPVLRLYQEEIYAAKRPDDPRVHGANPKTQSDRELLNQLGARETVNWQMDWRYHRGVRFFHELRGYHWGELDLTGRIAIRYEKLLAKWRAFVHAFGQLAPHVVEFEAYRPQFDDATGRIVEMLSKVPYFTNMEVWKQFRSDWKISPTLEYEWIAKMIEGMQRLILSHPKPIFQTIFLHDLPPEILHLIYLHVPFKDCCRLAMTSRYIR